MYRTMVKILEIWVPGSKHVIWWKKREPATERKYLPQYFGNIFFFYNLTCWRYEKALKNKCPKCNTYFLVHMGHWIFETFIPSASQIMKEGIYCQSTRVNDPFKKKFKFLYKIAFLGTGLFKVFKILTNVSYATNSSFTNNFKFTYPWQFFLFLDLW